MLSIAYCIPSKGYGFFIYNGFTKRNGLGPIRIIPEYSRQKNVLQQPDTILRDFALYFAQKGAQPPPLS